MALEKKREKKAHVIFRVRLVEEKTLRMFRSKMKSKELEV